MSTIIKKEIKENIELQERIKQGKLIDDDVCIKIFDDNFEFDKKILLDGFPRTLVQANWCVSFFEKENYDFVVLFIDSNIDNLIERIRNRKKIENRVDDDKAVFLNRIKIFEKEKKALVDCFKDKIIKINGDNGIEQVRDEIFSKLKSFYKLN